MWHMALAGSELARVSLDADAPDGPRLTLHFAVAQVRPDAAGHAAARFGQGDDTAYLRGVVWHVSGAVVTAQGLGLADAMGRLSDSRLVVQAQVLRDVAVPAELAGPLALDLGLAQGGELRVQGRALRCEVLGPWQPLPALAC